MSRRASKNPASDLGQEVESSDQVSGGGKTAYKRRRTAVACTSCRNRKSRCNGSRPSCSVCVQLGFQCIYEQPANLQQSLAGRPPDEYDTRLNSIEETLRLLVDQQKLQSQATYQTQRDLEGSVARAADNAHSEDVATLRDNEIDLLVDSEDSVDGMATIAEPTGRELQGFGPSSNIVLLGQISRLLTASLSQRDDTHRLGHSRERLVSRMPSPQLSPAGTTPANQANTNPCALPPQRDGLRMIEKFFSNTGMLFPFVSKNHMVNTYQKAGISRYRNVRRSWLCLLNVIFAFAMFTDISDGQPGEKDIQISGIYFNRAKDLLTESWFRVADLELVQSLVLMSLYRQGTQRLDETWSLHGLAVYAATQIGLNRVESGSNTNEVQTEMSKRTWLACLALDSTLSMTLGRPLSIPRYYSQINLPRSIVDEQGGYSGRTDTVCFFTSTVELYETQNDIIAKLYENNLSKSVRLRIEEALPELLKLEYRLDNWEQNLEPSLKLRPWITFSDQNAQSDPVFERLSVIIRLRGLHARLLLHRAILGALTAHCEGGRLEYNHQPSGLSEKLLQQSLRSCVSFATEIIKIVYEMSGRPSHLGSGWFSIYYTFHAMLVLIKCVVLHFGNFSTSPELPRPLWSKEAMAHAITALTEGKQAIARVGNGSQSSRRICRSLSKMFQACISVGASSEGITVFYPLLPHIDEMSQMLVAANTSSSDLENPEGDFQGLDLSHFDLDIPDGFDFLSTFGGYETGHDGLL